MNDSVSTVDDIGVVDMGMRVDKEEVSDTIEVFEDLNCFSW